MGTRIVSTAARASARAAATLGLSLTVESAPMIRKLAVSLFLFITAAVIAMLAIAAARPATFHLERSTTTTAEPQTVFAIVNDLHRFHEWSPWQKLDPAMKSVVQGAGVGPGTMYSWAGNDQVGEGRLTLTESTPVSHVGLKLEFLKPWSSTNNMHVRIVPEGDGSRVTWEMAGTNNFMAKLMSLFMSMDGMLGPDFASGLANLKRLSERDEAAAAAARMVL